MPAHRRLPLSLKRDEALRVTRVSIGTKKLVYVLVTDKKLTYRNGRSRIAYIGTTENGVKRVAESAAFRARRILSLRGVRTFHARIVTCRPRPNVRTWRKLERALLLEFRRRYGGVPRRNVQGNRIKERDEFRYFRRKRVGAVIEELS
jgi:hypothetical protein